MEKKEGVTRRKLLNLSLFGSAIVSLCGIIYPILKFILPFKYEEGSDRFDWKNLGDIRSVPNNTAKFFYYKDKPYVVINSGNVLTVLSGICTHMECHLKWDQDKKALVCPCHEATFDTMGNVKSGPAFKPLPSLDVRVVSGQILIGKSYGR